MDTVSRLTILTLLEIQMPSSAAVARIYIYIYIRARAQGHLLEPSLLRPYRLRSNPLPRELQFLGDQSHCAIQYDEVPDRGALSQ